MTQAEFIAYAQITPNQAQVNIWYTDTAPYIIKGITIPTVNILGQNITAFLDQVQQVVVPISIAGLTQDITLDIQTRQAYYTPGGNFYYFDVTPLEVTSITTGAFTGISAEVSLSPAIDSNIFNESPYNVLQGLVENTRKSDYIMFSDRYKVGIAGLPGYTGPTNIDLLLSGSASLADVQDSLYTDTGWVNARYSGTKTDSTDYHSDSAVTGKIFQAAQYPYNTSTPDISSIQYQVSSSTVVYSDYFYTGIGDAPGFSAPQAQVIRISGSNYYSNTTNFYIKGYLNQDPTTYLPKLGDTLAINGASTGNIGDDFEIVTVYSVSLYQTSPYIVYIIQVQRNMKGSTAQIVPSNDNLLFNITPTQILKLQGNKVVGVNKSLLLVAETGKILTLDNDGHVVGSQ